MIAELFIRTQQVLADKSYSLTLMVIRPDQLNEAAGVEFMSNDRGEGVCG